MAADQRRGVWFAVACYVAWGLFPIYWKQLANIPAIDILANRMVWSLAFVLLLLLFRQDWGWIGKAVRNRHVVLPYLAAALLLSVNWYIYIWAVNANYVVESSLGYFINPLVSVLFAVIFLHERLRPWQWAAIGIAAAGVVFLTVTYGQLPWIALALALTFALYGLIKKRARLDALRGMAMETACMFLPALIFLLYRSSTGHGSVGAVSPAETLLLMGTGVVTVLPLYWFASAAHLIPLALLGILQYIAPTLQFTLGIALYHEPFSLAKLAGFSIIWVALLIYWAEGMLHRQRGATSPQVTLSSR